MKMECKKIAGYTFSRLIGVGTYAEVYEVENDNGEPFAMKIISKKQNKEMLRGELEAMQHLRHSNIVSALDIFESDTHIFIIMPYFDGGDLLDEINERGSFSENKFREIFRQLIDALKYAHSEGWIHRDIKPENILLSSDGRAFISAWGFACKWNEDAYIFRSYGSLLYSSPEIVQGKKYRGPEVDCWSLGCVLYTCVAGTLPFSKERAFDSEEILRRNITAANYQENVDFSPELRDLISQMLDGSSKTRITLDEIKKHPWMQLSSCNGGLSPSNNKANNAFREANF